MFDDLHDLGADADFMEIALARVADGGVLLGDDDDEIIVPRRCLDGSHRRFPADFEWADVTWQLHLGP
jgi:hypothetical protein